MPMSVVYCQMPVVHYHVFFYPFAKYVKKKAYYFSRVGYGRPKTKKTDPENLDKKMEKN